MKLTTLAEAIDEHVRPGAHLNFASTPSRSNAAILALAKRYRGEQPGFTFSSTGFHSLAHLLGLLRLGARYLACFYGDNYPTPRPNRLYQDLIEEGVVLEHWSLWSYVCALRAGAQGEPFALTTGLLDTSLAEGLAGHSRYFETELRQPDGETQRIGALRALCPDLSFVHVPLASAKGHAWLSAPHCEGLHGALGARRGVIITADRIVDDAVVLARPELVRLPAHRVLAVCEAPFGAHPQPVHVAGPAGDELCYDDDTEHYVLWRQMCSDRALFTRFCDEVLSASDVLGAYRNFVGAKRLEQLKSAATTEMRGAGSATIRDGLVASTTTRDVRELEPESRLTLLGARVLTEQVRERRHQALLAGIGQAFNAARLCRALLEPAHELELMVETGLCGFEDDEHHELDGYLLSRRNIAASKRLSGVEHVLGTLVRGTATRCLAVVGAAEIDSGGNLNSSFVGGRLLVGSGGACDIASGAQQLVVLVRSDRLVPRVAYTTSVGHRVSHVVTESFVLERMADGWAQRGFDSAQPPTPWPGVTPGPPLDTRCASQEWSLLARLERSVSKQPVA